MQTYDPVRYDLIMFKLQTSEISTSAFTGRNFYGDLAQDLLSADEGEQCIARLYAINYLSQPDVISPEEWLAILGTIEHTAMVRGFVRGSVGEV